MKLPDFKLDCVSVSSRLPEYNSLKDSNLAAFFSNKGRRKLLYQNRLIAPNGALLNPRKHSQASSNFYKGRRVAKSTSSKVQPLSKEKFHELISKLRDKT